MSIQFNSNFISPNQAIPTGLDDGIIIIDIDRYLEKPFTPRFNVAGTVKANIYPYQRLIAFGSQPCFAPNHGKVHEGYKKFCDDNSIEPDSERYVSAFIDKSKNGEGIRWRIEDAQKLLLKITNQEAGATEERNELLKLYSAYSALCKSMFATISKAVNLKLLKLFY